MPSYEKNKSSGLWSVRFREKKPDGTLKNKRLSGFETKKAAQYGYEDYITEQKNRKEEENKIKHETTHTEEMTFDTLLALYYQYEKPRVKESSFYDISTKTNRNILSFFSGMKLSEITPAKILEWQSSIDHFSYRYKKNLNTYLASIYNYGEKYHDIFNVMKKVDRPRNLEAKKEMLFWSPEEFSKFIAKVERPEYAALYRFLYVTGCRRGEALALTWKDIDLIKGTAKIEKSVAFKIKVNGKSYQITTPKNAGSNRTVTLPRFFCEQLKEYAEWQKENCQKIDFVFGGEDPLPPTSIERNMTAAANKAEVKRIRVHDLRHSCASFLIHKGVTIVAVSRRLGHTSIEQTLNTYSHMMPDDQTIILKSLDTLEGSV